MRIALTAALAAVPVLTGCTEPNRPLAVVDLGSGDLLDAPWPSDARRDPDGTISVAGFPNPTGSGFVQGYLELAEQMTGFGSNGAAFFRFRAPIDAARLPHPGATLEDGAALAMFAIAPGQPWDGERIPVQWHFQREATSFEPSNLLAVAPVWGFPLRPDTTYGVVVSTEVARAPDALELDPRLVDALPRHGYGLEDIAVGTAFTTGDPTAELARIAAFLRERVEHPPLSQTLRQARNTQYHQTYAGTVPGPLFQHGQRPYAFEGGGFRFRESDGQPIIAAWEPLRLAVTVPRVDPPAGGFPVVLYQHGTFGDAFGFASGADRLSVGAVLARAGFVGIGIDQPLHGARSAPGTDQSLHTFNYFNPESARAVIRQGAIDAIWMAELLAEPTVFDTPDGEVQLDPERVFFMGHSQGGLTGAVAGPWLGDRMRGVVLSGAGGGIAITILERKDPLDISATVEALLEFDEDEHLHELHPVITLVQTLVDVTDPINYAPYWFAEAGAWGPESSASFLHFSGLNDAQTPARTGEALAVAGRLSPLTPSFPQSEGMALRGLPELEAARGNGLGWGEPVTAAFSQWARGDHFVIFDDADAAETYTTFLETGLDGLPTARRP